MDHRSGSDSPPVYHGRDQAAMRWPRLFALLDYAGEESETRDLIRWYGLAIPGGSAATIWPDGRPHGRWISAERLAVRLDLELVWLDPAT
jgi:hypothetical protein